MHKGLFYLKIYKMTGFVKRTKDIPGNVVKDEELCGKCLIPLLRVNMQVPTCNIFWLPQQSHLNVTHNNVRRKQIVNNFFNQVSIDFRRVVYINHSWLHWFETCCNQPLLGVALTLTEGVPVWELTLMSHIVGIRGQCFHRFGSLIKLLLLKAVSKILLQRYIKLTVHLLSGWPSSITSWRVSGMKVLRFWLQSFT